jgi:hypothetical protein
MSSALSDVYTRATDGIAGDTTSTRLHPSEVSSMRRDLRNFELPGAFAQRYRPVRVHPQERGLAAFVLDEYGLRFFRLMATGAPVLDGAIWSIVQQAQSASIQLLPRRCRHALAYVVCELPNASAEPTPYPIPRRLTFRAKVTIAALQSLLNDLAHHPAESAGDVTALIEHRIDQLRI